MSYSPISLADSRQLASAACDRVQASYEQRKPAKSSQITPGQLRQGIDQFYDIAGKAEYSEDSAPYAIGRDDITQIGDYGLSMIQDMAAWAAQLGLEQERRELDRSTLGIADWIAQNKGEIRTAHSIVNALAELANSTKDEKKLKQYAKLANDIVHACGKILRNDLEKTDPSRPWRLLQMNRAIMATRTHKPELMRQIFDEFIEALPDEAPRFFREGMNEMERLGYPEHVRAVMQEYFDAWTRKTMN